MDAAELLEKDFLLQHVHKDNAALQAKIRGLSVRLMRVLFREMRAVENDPHREDMLLPFLGCTLAEFSVLHLMRPH